MTEGREYILQMVELGFEPQPWVQEINTVYQAAWLDNTSHEEEGKPSAQALQCPPLSCHSHFQPQLRKRDMETPVLRYLLWAIQLAREAQCANLGSYDSSTHHCAAKPFIYVPISICSALGN